MATAFVAPVRGQSPGGLKQDSTIACRARDQTLLLLFLITSTSSSSSRIPGCGHVGAAPAAADIHRRLKHLRLSNLRPSPATYSLSRIKGSGTQINIPDPWEKEIAPIAVTPAFASLRCEPTAFTHVREELIRMRQRERGLERSVLTPAANAHGPISSLF